MNFGGKILSRRRPGIVNTVFDFSISTDIYSMST